MQSIPHLTIMTKQRNLTGKYLNKLWNVGAKHALYREDGKWYHQLTEFPGAFFDASGYVIFETEKDFLESPYLQIGQDVHLTDGISSMPRYIRISERSQVQSISQSAKKVLEKQKVYDSKIAVKPQGKHDVRRNLIQIERIVRDTKVSLWVKYIHEYKCQICGTTLKLDDNLFYAEAHHIKPLGNSHNGSDVVENIICVCPNHHALLDLGAIYIEQSQLRHIEGHEINLEYIAYHNTVIYNKTG
jgi:5-methylcytosine-specific restriction enzyme A